MEWLVIIIESVVSKKQAFWYFLLLYALSPESCLIVFHQTLLQYFLKGAYSLVLVFSITL